MALFSECMPKCAQNVLDIADIVREGILRQPSSSDAANSSAFIDLLCLAGGRKPLAESVVNALTDSFWAVFSGRT